MSTTHKLFGERINPSKQQLKRKLRQATTESGFQMKPGYLYTVVRAISARVNQNYDGWPSDELKKSYHTFIGKPVFVNHENYDPKTARGVVVAARYVENGRDKYVEVIQEIDAPTFPLLAHEIKTGGLDSVSMGAEAGFTICSVCDNKAVDERDMCQHVMFHKGEMLPRKNRKTGKVERVLCYESCHKLGFFELSYVFDPADETAVASKVLMASDDKGRLAGKYTKEDFAIDDGKLPWEREKVDPELEDAVVTAFRKGAPFADYDDFADCTSKNSDKRDSDAYCGEIKYRAEDKKSSRRQAADVGSYWNWYKEQHPEGISPQSLYDFATWHDRHIQPGQKQQVYDTAKGEVAREHGGQMPAWTSRWDHTFGSEDDDLGAWHDLVGSPDKQKPTTGIGTFGPEGEHHFQPGSISQPPGHNYEDWDPDEGQDPFDPRLIGASFEAAVLRTAGFDEYDDFPDALQGYQQHRDDTYGGVDSYDTMQHYVDQANDSHGGFSGKTEEKLWDYAKQRMNAPGFGPWGRDTQHPQGPYPNDVPSEKYSVPPSLAPQQRLNSYEVAVLRTAGFKRADNECLPGEDCDSGSAGPSGPDTKSDPNLQPLTPGAGDGGGGSASAPAAGTSAPVSTDGGAAASGNGVAPGPGGVPITIGPDGRAHSSDPAWEHLLDRESGGRNIGQGITDANGGPGSPNAAQGYFQITPDTWKAHGGDKYAPNPMAASPEQQGAVAADIFRANPSGGDWGAGMAGREDAGALARGLGGPNPAAPKTSSFQARVLTAAGFQAPPPENSAHTQVSNTMGTYLKAHDFLSANGAPKAKGRTLDFGAGLGHSKQFGHTFEPHPRPGFKPTYADADDIPDGAYHRVTNLNVLNVVPPAVRDQIVDHIGRVMAPGGQGIITTRGRGEVLSTKGGVPANNGDPNAIIVDKGGPKERYQKGFDPKELHQYVSGRLGDGYDVSPLKLGPAGVHIVRKAGTTASTRRKAWGETEAPVHINTLREEGSAPEDDSDDFYHFVESPRELRTPDLTQAGDIDQAQSAEGQGAEDLPGAEDGADPALSVGGGDDDGQQYITLKIPLPPNSQSDTVPSQPFDAGPAPAPPPGAAPPPGPQGPPPPGAMPPGGPPPPPGAPPVPPEQQQIAASTLAYFNRYFGRRVANWYDAIEQGREMTAAERADYQLQASTLRNTAEVSTTSRTPKEGTANMGRSTLAERGKTASRGRRQHFAEGPLTDGGDVSRNDQGEQEEAFISETPPAEAVVAPTDDTPNISNTENNLVARVQLGQQQLLRDAQALAALRARQGNRRTAEEKTEAGGPVATTVDPALSGTDDQSLKGDDFQSANPNDGVVATNPHDASLKAFKVFDRWLAKKTGKPSNQHTAATIRRYAEHYANATDTPIQAYFPALGIVLREARKNEKAAPAKRRATNVKGAKMRKRSNESLDVAAPDGRADVEAPTENTTDADAQASQFDTRDFGNNAGDDIAKPDLSTDQNFAPGEAAKTGRAKTAGELLGIQCAEAMIEAGLEPNDRKRKYALAAEFGRMNRGLILDRIALAERFAQVLNQTHAHYARKVASGNTRGATRSPLPPGMSGGAPRQMTAGSRRTAANDPSNDSLMFG